jgi:hypothetical protein
VGEPSVFERVVAEALCAHGGLCFPGTTAAKCVHPECALHALATSSEVREALVEALMPMEQFRRGYPLREDEAVGAILAALDPEAT